MTNEDDTRVYSSDKDTTKAKETGHEERMKDFSRDWCRKLLDDPSFEQTDAFSRRPPPHSSDASYSTLMRKTLFTDQTIRAMKYLYKPPEAFAGESRTSISTTSNGRVGGELLALISVGGEMCSHPNTLHGGINTVLVDEIGGGLAFREIPNAQSLMAVNFNVNLRKSVKTPGLILGRAWVERPSEGRKVWIKVQLEQDGVTCIESENMYLKVKPKGKL